MKNEGGVDLSKFSGDKDFGNEKNQSNYYNNTLVSLVVALYGAIALYAFNAIEYDILSFVLLLVVSGLLWVAILVSIIKYINSDRDCSNIIIVICFFFALSVMTFIFLSSYSKKPTKTKLVDDFIPQNHNITVDMAKCKFTIPHTEEGYTVYGNIKGKSFEITQKPFQKNKKDNQNSRSQEN
jgi:hypothetical protein